MPKPMTRSRRPSWTPRRSKRRTLFLMVAGGCSSRGVEGKKYASSGGQKTACRTCFVTTESRGIDQPYRRRQFDENLPADRADLYSRIIS